MTTFRLWDIVVVPFPFSDTRKSKPRPALVVSRKRFNDMHDHTTLMMITSALHTSWPSDVLISANASSGLPITSIVRMKLFTLDNTLVRRKIGSLAKTSRSKVLKQLRTHLA